MSNSNKRKPSARPAKQGNELLDELDSIKALLDDELDNPPSYSSVAEIASVKEYLRIKKVADAAKLSVEEYLAQQTGTRESEKSGVHGQSKAKTERSPSETSVHDNAIPVLDEVIATDEAIPVLAEITPPGQAVSEEMSLKKVQQVVDIIVNHKLERLRAQLKKEVIQELQKLLPLTSQKKK